MPNKNSNDDTRKRKKVIDSEEIKNAFLDVPEDSLNSDIGKIAEKPSDTSRAIVPTKGAAPAVPLSQVKQEVEADEKCIVEGFGDTWSVDASGASRVYLEWSDVNNCWEKRTLAQLKKAFGKFTLDSSAIPKTPLFHNRDSRAIISSATMDSRINQVCEYISFDRKDNENYNPRGCNLNNGFLDQKTKSFIPHQGNTFVKDSRVCDSVKVDFDPKLLPPQELMLSIVSMLNNDPVVVYQFFMMLKIIIFGPYMGVQTGFFLWGSPGCGKTVLVEWIKFLVGPQNFTTIQVPELKRNMFLLSTLPDKRVASIPECNVILSAVADDTLKQVMSHDSMSAPVKHQTEKKDFIPSAVVLLAGNVHPYTVLPSDALKSRVLPILVVKAFKKENPNFLDELIKHSAGFINIAFHISEENVLNFVRATEFVKGVNYDEDYMGRFIGDHCVFDPKGSIAPKTLELKLKELNPDLTPKPSIVTIVSNLMSTSDRVWGKVLNRPDKRQYILSPKEAREKWSKTDLAPAIQGDDFLVPPIICSGRTPGCIRTQLIYGIRAKRIGENGAEHQLPDPKRDVNLFQIKPPEVSEANWKAFKKAIDTHISEAKEQVTNITSEEVSSKANHDERSSEVSQT